MWIISYFQHTNTAIGLWPAKPSILIRNMFIKATFYPHIIASIVSVCYHHVAIYPIISSPLYVAAKRKQQSVFVEIVNRPGNNRGNNMLFVLLYNLITDGDKVSPVVTITFRVITFAHSFIIINVHLTTIERTCFNLFLYLFLLLWDEVHPTFNCWYS